MLWICTQERSLELVKAAQENDLQGVENMVSGGQCDINYQDKVSHEKLVDGNIRERRWWIKIIMMLIIVVGKYSD